MRLHWIRTYYRSRRFNYGRASSAWQTARWTLEHWRIVMRPHLTFVEVLIVLCAAALVVTLAVVVAQPRHHCDHTQGTCERGWDQ